MLFVYYSIVPIPPKTKTRCLSVFFSSRTVSNCLVIPIAIRSPAFRPVDVWSGRGVHPLPDRAFKTSPFRARFGAPSGLKAGVLNQQGNRIIKGTAFGCPFCLSPFCYWQRTYLITAFNSPLAYFPAIFSRSTGLILAACPAEPNAS